MQPSKRVRLEIPAVSTSVDVVARPEAEALALPFQRKPIPFSHIKDFTEMVENMERIVVWIRVTSICSDKRVTFKGTTPTDEV